MLDEITVNKLRWLFRVIRRCGPDIVCIAIEINAEGKIGRGLPEEEMGRQGIENDTRIAGISKEEPCEIVEHYMEV